MAASTLNTCPPVSEDMRRNLRLASAAAETDGSETTAICRAITCVDAVNNVAFWADSMVVRDICCRYRRRP
jgi:hypothetical protein